MKYTEPNDKLGEYYIPKYDKIYSTDSELNKYTNILFELSEIKILLRYYNKENYYYYYEKIRRDLSLNLNSILIPIENTPKTIYLSYYSVQSMKNNISDLSILDNNPLINIILAIDNPDKRQLIINRYENDKEILNQERKDNKYIDKIISRLILINRKDEETDIKDEDDILYINESSLISSITSNIARIIFEYTYSIIGKKYNEGTNCNMDLNDDKEKVVQFIQVQFYDLALGIANKYINSCYYDNIECAKWKEIKAVILFLDNYHNNIISSEYHNVEFEDSNVDVDVNYNKNIIDLINDLYDDVFKRYNKEKNDVMLIQSYCRYLNMISHNNINHIYVSKKSTKYLEILNGLLNVLNTTDNYSKFICLLKLANMFIFMKYYKKANIFMFFSLLVCLFYQNSIDPAIDIDTSVTNKSIIEFDSMVPYLIKKISYIFNIYDISKNNINSYKEFLYIHKKIIDYHDRIQTFYIKKENDKLIKIDNFNSKEQLYIKNNLNFIDKYIYFTYWDQLQIKIYLIFINYYNNFADDTINSLNFIKIVLSYLQNFYMYLSEAEQTNILLKVKELSSLLQNKYIFNLYRIPVLIKIIPIPSDIKFDTSVNSKRKEKNNDIFIYNPWLKDKNLNYYWTTNSIIKLKIKLFNPLKTKIIISKLTLLYSEPIINKIESPKMYHLEPLECKEIIFDIKILKECTISIIGIQYEFMNISAKQYVDSNGNGLYFAYINFNKDHLNIINNKREIIHLNNIKIYHEIPLLINNNNLMDKTITLFKNQIYTFSFNLTNIGNYDIDKLIIYVFGYKDNKFKIKIDKDELYIKICKNDNYIYTYKYNNVIDKIEKIEFRIYYSSIDESKYSEANNDYLISPFIYYINYIETIDLFLFTNQKIIPLCNSIDTYDLIQSDITINKRYNTFFISNYFFISFNVKNISQYSIIYDLSSKDNKKLLRNNGTLENDKNKVLFFEIGNTKLENISLKWKIKDSNINGEINLLKIFSKCDHIFFDTISNNNITCFNLNIDKELIDNHFKIKYMIRNNTNKTISNIDVKIYLFQNNSDKEENNCKYIFNNNLKDEIMYEGTLEFKINNLLPSSTYINIINLYLLEKEIIKTTFILIDKDNKTNYLCPFITSMSI